MHNSVLRAMLNRRYGYGVLTFRTKNILKSTKDKTKIKTTSMLFLYKCLVIRAICQIDAILHFKRQRSTLKKKTNFSRSSVCQNKYTALELKLLLLSTCPRQIADCKCTMIMLNGYNLLKMKYIIGWLSLSKGKLVWYVFSINAVNISIDTRCY